MDGQLAVGSVLLCPSECRLQSFAADVQGR